MSKATTRIFNSVKCGRETKSVVPIICVHVTRKLDFSVCTKIWKTAGVHSVIYFKF